MSARYGTGAMPPAVGGAMDSAGNPRSYEVLPCWLDGEVYAFDLRQIDRLEPGGRIHMDGESGWLLGRERIPVYDLAQCMGRRLKGYLPRGRVVVVRDEVGTWGMAVDRIGRAFRVRQLQTLPKILGNEHPFESAAIRDERLTLMLSIPRLNPRASQQEEWAPSPPRVEIPSLSGSEGKGRLLCFRAGWPVPKGRPLLFGVSLRQLVEILHPLEVLEVPGARASIKGVIPWRGQVVAVVDLLRSLGGLRFPPDEIRRLLVVRTGDGELLGLPTGPDLRIRSLPMAGRPAACPTYLEAEKSLASFEIEDGYLVLPDLRDADCLCH